MSKDLILLTTPESSNENLNPQQWPALAPHAVIISIHADDLTLPQQLDNLFANLPKEAENPRTIFVITNPDRKEFLDSLFMKMLAQFIKLSKTTIEMRTEDPVNALIQVQQKYTGQIIRTIPENFAGRDNSVVVTAAASEDATLPPAPEQTTSHSMHYCSLVLDAQLTREAWAHFLAARKKDTQIIVIAPVDINSYRNYIENSVANFRGLANVLDHPSILFIPIATAVDLGKPLTDLKTFQNVTQRAKDQVTQLVQKTTTDTIIIVPSTTAMIPAFGDGSGQGGKLPVDLSNEANAFFAFVKQCAASHQALSVSKLDNYSFSSDPKNPIQTDQTKIEQKVLRKCEELIDDCLQQFNNNILSKFFSSIKEKDILSWVTQLANIQLSIIPPNLKQKINKLAYALLMKAKENTEKPENLKKYLLLLGTLRDISSTPKPAYQEPVAAAALDKKQDHASDVVIARQQFNSIIHVAIGDMTGVPKEFTAYAWSDAHAAINLHTALERLIENHYSDDTAMMIAFLDAIQQFILTTAQKQPIEQIMPILFECFHNWCHKGTYNGECGGPTWGMGGLTSFVLRDAKLPKSTQIYSIARALNEQIQQGRDGNAAAMRVAPACLAAAPGFAKKIEAPIVAGIDPKLDHAMRLARVQADTAGSGADAISWAMLLAYFMVKLQIIKTEHPELSGAELAKNLIKEENLIEFQTIANSQRVFTLSNSFSEQTTVSLSQTFLAILESRQDEQNPHYNWRNNEHCEISRHKGVKTKVYGAYSLNQMALILWVLQQIATKKINDLDSLLNLITGAGGDADTNAAVMMMFANFFPESLVESIRILNQRPINVTRKIPIAEEGNLVKFVLNILKLLWGEAVYHSLQEELTTAGILFGPTEAEQLLNMGNFELLLTRIKETALVTLLYPIPSHLQLLLDTDERPLYLSLAAHPSPSLLGEMFRRFNAAHHQNDRSIQEKYQTLIKESLSALEEKLAHYATYQNNQTNYALPTLAKLFFMGTATDLAMPPPHVERRQTYHYPTLSVTLYDWLTLPEDQALRQQLNQVLKNFLVLAHSAGCLADAEKALNPVIKKLTAAEQKDIFPAPGKKSAAALQQ